MLWRRISLMGQEDGVALNVAAQKLAMTLTKLRPAEDKMMKALPTWTDEETDDAEDVPSRSNLVNYHTSNVLEKEWPADVWLFAAVHCWCTVMFYWKSEHTYCPTWPQGTPFPPFLLVHSLPHLLLFFYFSPFPFLIRLTYFLLLSIPSLSTRIVPLHFHAGGRKKWLNRGLVCCVYFMLSVLFS